MQGDWSALSAVVEEVLGYAGLSASNRIDEYFIRYLFPGDVSDIRNPEEY